MILVCFLYMLFASTFIFGKLALSYCDPLFFIGVRMIIGGSLLLGYQYFFNRKQWKFSLRNSGLYSQIILFHIFCAFVLEFWALKYVTASKACLIYNLSPFLTALYAYLFFSERLNTKKWLGLAVGFGGLLPVLLAPSLIEDQVGGVFNISWPEMALLGAVASSAYGWIVMKKLLHKQYSFIMVNGIGMFGGGILAFVSSLLIEGTPTLKMPEVKNFLDTAIQNIFSSYAPVVLLMIYMAILIVIANIICYNIYGYLLSRYSPTFLSFAGFTTPLFAALFDWMLMGEIISWPFVISVMLTFWGLYIFYLQEIKPENNNIISVL